MSLRSSLHIFSPKREKVLEYLTGELENACKEREALNDYLEKIQRLCRTDFQKEPMHDRERFFLETIRSLHETDVPPFILECELRKMGVPLRVHGDLILFRDHVTCLSSRVFSCGDRPEGVMFHRTKSASWALRSTVVSYSLAAEGVSVPECRVYFANKSRVGCLLKRPDPAYCFHKNTELLRELWPEADWDAIEAQRDILAFSDAVSAAMNIRVDEDLSGYQYLGVQRLYGIYQAP